MAGPVYDRRVRKHALPWRRVRCSRTGEPGGADIADRPAERAILGVVDHAVGEALDGLGISLGQAFGPGVLESRFGAFTQMQARGQAAENLLTKAVRRLGEGDVAGADALISRVVAMADPAGDPPWDEAQMMLHNAVCNVLETSAEDDASWLERAEKLFPGLEGLPRLALEDVLAVTLSDYHLRPQESRRVRKLVRSADPGAAVDRLIQDGTVDTVEAMRQILTVVLMYRRTGPGPVGPR